jgi:hypothetical protein
MRPSPIAGLRSVRGTPVTATGVGFSGVYSRRVVLDGLVAHGNDVGSAGPTSIAESPSSK